ncbi:hypothetical protein SYNPS1DRAFT_25324 [Syncephalis pseudoplumigaleata]|uniref:Uncharacterized protein n=2 Tax=Syncephalis pseudoplumigaleata TaxID=1712513 RepID=A0A4P9YTT7_9FUNG|nr:hypothetical protein SYNPS1DRAFT_25324 [Syncephalis pseudoplumigaleata]|eukprot:RKP22792.1 hypothetical protein SYNPS1DRAFT_25324 [Syncephalis pseudoplumigaleata]
MISRIVIAALLLNMAVAQMGVSAMPAPNEPAVADYGHKDYGYDHKEHGYDKDHKDHGYGKDKDYGHDEYNKYGDGYGKLLRRDDSYGQKEHGYDKDHKEHGYDKDHKDHGYGKDKDYGHDEYNKYGDGYGKLLRRDDSYGYNEHNSWHGEVFDNGYGYNGNSHGGHWDGRKVSQGTVFHNGAGKSWSKVSDLKRRDGYSHPNSWEAGVTADGYGNGANWQGGYWNGREVQQGTAFVHGHGKSWNDVHDHHKKSDYDHHDDKKEYGHHEEKKEYGHYDDKKEY